MSAGSLPLSTYHRASQVGEGSFGSVVTVYNDDGEEFALKLFLPEDDDDEEESQQAIDVGALREISCLRLLRNEKDKQHPNIIRLCDVQTEWTDDGEEGAGTAGCLSMAIPLYRGGSLMSAIEEGTFQRCSRRVKVQIAHDILSAVDFLHSNGILHRDIKSDNVLLDQIDDTTWRAVLIDFSLAKPVDDCIFCQEIQQVAEKEITNHASSTLGASKHTSEIGTLVYIAPEVVDQSPYGKPVDLWSVGVVLLELLTGQPIEGNKPKQVAQAIQEALNSLPENQLFPDLIRSLLQTDPSERLTSRQALQHALFTEKFNLSVPEVRHVHVATALPYEDTEDDAEENNSPNNERNKKARKNALAKRVATIERVCQYLESQQTITRQAALEYCEQLEQLDDSIDNLKESQSLLDCVVLAHRFFEVDLPDLKELDESESGMFANWNLEDYLDNEATIFMILDYCLYPRAPQL